MIRTTGFILRRFKILECPSFAAKDSFRQISSKLISVQLHACVAYTTIDGELYHGFVYLVDFTKFLTWDKFFWHYIWRFVCFGQNLSRRDKPSALIKCWRWQNICLNKQLCHQCGKALTQTQKSRQSKQMIIIPPNTAEVMAQPIKAAAWRNQNTKEIK